MICRCFGKTLDFAALGSAARLILGVPDYEVYIEHLRVSHPEQAPLGREAFLAARQGARFSGLRCC